MADGFGTSAMLTDLYQLTMAYGYWKTGKAETEACFHLTFRENPFGGGYAVGCGLQQAVDYLRSFAFTPEDIDWMRSRTGSDGRAIFEEEFLQWLGELRFTCQVDAVPEGTVVFPNLPLIRVVGPIVQCQLVETALLNSVNFQTLIATKASRVCLAAEGDPVVEFGLRRAQGPDGGVSASRASFVGGCVGTSNALAAKLFGIPAVGTHAHSWVMAFDSETEAFEAYVEAMPNNATLLVDTYDTLEGVRRAAEVGRRLRERGHELAGVRIDSGDLAWLSIRAREILDEAGLPDARIVASSELDEHIIGSLKDQGAAIDLWGVGTKMATAFGQPALGGVYKLSAVREPHGEWRPRIKVSEQTAKVTVPGILGARRYVREGRFAGDLVYNLASMPRGGVKMVDPADPTRSKSFGAEEPFEELLLPIFRSGRLVHDPAPPAVARERALSQLEMLDPSVKRFLNPHAYPVGLEDSLNALRLELILEAREEGK